MNPRERLLACAVLIIVVVAGGALMAHQFFLVPLDERNATLAALRQDLQTKRDRILQVQALQPKMETWRQQSLPASSDLARREYEKYLSDLLRKSGFAAGSFSVVPKPPDSKTSPTLPGKKDPIYVRLTFTVQAHGTLTSLVSLLERFYRTSLLHQVKNLNVQRPLTTVGTEQRSDELDMNLSVEAIILSGAEDRSVLLPGVDRRLLAIDVVTTLQRGPSGLALVPWAAGVTGPLGPRHLASSPRQYVSIAGKNIFYGPPANNFTDKVDATQFVHLTDITHTEDRIEAFLYDRYNNRKTRLRVSPGFNSFRVQDEEGETVLRGTMVQIDDREVIFRAEDRYYSLHVGQSLREALKKPLNSTQVKGLGIEEPVDQDQ